MNDVADDLALIVRNAIAYIKELERQINELKRKAEPVQAGCDHCNHPLYAALKCKNCGGGN